MDRRSSVLVRSAAGLHRASMRRVIAVSFAAASRTHPARRRRRRGSDGGQRRHERDARRRRPATPARLPSPSWRRAAGASKSPPPVTRRTCSASRSRSIRSAARTRRLEIGALTDRVEVTAPLADLRRGSPAMGTVVDNRQILDMPLDGRNFLELTLLAPGTVPAAQGSAGSVRGDFSFSVNGGREDFNSFLLDGADNVDPKLNTVGVRPPVDAIQEFEVLTSTPEASLGRQAASQVSVVLKSGTNGCKARRYDVLSQRRARCAQLLRAEERACAGISAQPVRASRSAARSCATGRSSLPITKARAPTKASRASRTVPTDAARGVASAVF